MNRIKTEHLIVCLNKLAFEPSEYYGCFGAELLEQVANRLEALERVAVAARKECDPSKKLRTALKKLDDKS